MLKKYKTDIEKELTDWLARTNLVQHVQNFESCLFDVELPPIFSNQDHYLRQT